MTYRVVQWATGNVGRSAVEGIVAHPELELAGAWVHSESKAGRDVGEICGIAPLGVIDEGTVAARRFGWQGLVNGAPGIRTYLDLPLVSGRAARDLIR
jgi:hypothetical protein